MVLDSGRTRFKLRAADSKFEQQLQEIPNHYSMWWILANSNLMWTHEQRSETCCKIAGGNFTTDHKQLHDLCPLRPSVTLIISIISILFLWVIVCHLMILSVSTFLSQGIPFISVCFIFRICCLNIRLLLCSKLVSETSDLVLNWLEKRSTKSISPLMGMIQKMLKKHNFLHSLGEECPQYAPLVDNKWISRLHT